MSFVPPEGPRDAKIAIVGEAPGRVELMTGRPFSGPSGEQLNDILNRCGLRRGDVYITNTIKDSDKTPTPDDISRALPALYRELTDLPACNVFIPLGNVALQALSCFQYNSITRYRGSILEPTFGGKMIPSVHPAWYMRGEWRYKPVVIADFQRALRESRRWGIQRPARTYIVEPTYEQAVEKLREYRDVPELCFDIETFGNWVACIGFAPSPWEATCIPILRAGFKPYWSIEQEAGIWCEIAETLAAPSKKIGQNLPFDIYKLGEHGVEVCNFAFDTMTAHHLLVPELPHGLDFIASLYSEEPYYKDEGKTWDHSTPDRQLWIYNCKDCTTEFECKINLERDLRDEGMYDYFVNYVMELPVPLLEMQRDGLLVNRDRLFTERAELELALSREQEELNKRIGRAVNVKSPGDCLFILQKFGINPTRTTATGRPKLDEESLRIYTARYENPVFDLLFSIRRKRTLISGFLNLKTDADGYYHASYLIHGTKSGRLASRGTGEGPQIQNVPEGDPTCRHCDHEAHGDAL